MSAAVLPVGVWYCIGFFVDDYATGEQRKDLGPIYKLAERDESGRGVWVNEDDEIVEEVFDPGLQISVHPDAADFWVPQS